MRHRLISISLQRGFIFSALLTLFVGIVSLYAWNQQKEHINNALNEDFSIIQSSFHIEQDLILFFNEFNELILAKTLSEHVVLRDKLQQRLFELRLLALELDDSQLSLQIEKTALLLKELDLTIELRLQLQANFSTLLSHIDWLHDDFHYEFNALLQDITWQQSSKLDVLTKEDDPINQHRQQENLRELQEEFRQVYQLMTLENQIVQALKTMIADGNSAPQHRLNYLKNSVEMVNRALNPLSSTVAIRQIVDELLLLGLEPKQLPALIAQRDALLLKQQHLLQKKEQVLNDFRKQIENNLGGSHQQLKLLQNIIEKTTRLSGWLIVCAMIGALLFVIVINYFYIRPRLLSRFVALNQAVERLNQGEQNVKIAVYGDDELGGIARLLRRFLMEMRSKNNKLNNQNQQLIKEINDRITAEQQLLNTQDELIQAAKLAIVGQTLTTLGHEINQPLNALGAYTFSAKRALEKGDYQAVNNYLGKISQLIERTATIIRRLRQFSRRRSQYTELQSIDFNHSVTEAWNLLEPKHRPLQGTLQLPQRSISVLGDEVLLQQVMVNLFTNAIEASGELAPTIELEYEESEHYFTVYVTDNGVGWPLALADKLLRPFSSSKSVNLGIGLSISYSIMEQCQGSLRIASTLDHHALIILELRKSASC